MAAQAGWIDRVFKGRDGAAILSALRADTSDVARDVLGLVFCAVLRWRRLAPWKSCIGLALRPISARPWPWNTRFTYRATARSDFLEGIRAAIIDKDRAPRWRHAGLAEVCAAEVEAMLAPLGAAEMTFETEGERL